MENYYKEIKKILKDQYWYNDDIIDQIYNKITEYTNKNLNFEYYQSGYDDVISDINNGLIFGTVWEWDKVK